MEIRTRRIVLIAFLLAPQLVVAQPADDRRPGERPFPAIPQLMERAGIPGLSLAVIRDGRLERQAAFGLRRAGTDERVDTATVFEAASLSKPIFAYAVLRLHERGVIDLDVPLAEYLPYPRLAHEPRARRITARMALSHSTGLPNWGGDSLQLSFDPGEEFSYSGEGYVYLQKTVETITGRTLQELAEREVLEPLKMHRSSYVWREAFADNAAFGHDELGRPRELREHSSGNAAFSLLTTAGDYARFVSALLSGHGLDEESLRAVLTPQVAITDGDVPAEALGWGLGWGLQRTDSGSAIWHWGDNGVFRCYVLAYPETGDGFVYFTNSNNGLSVAPAVAERFVGGAQPALEWLGYATYDDPRRLARLAIGRAALEGGPERALRHHWEMRTIAPEVVDLGVTDAVGDLLLDEGHTDAALELLRLNAERYPDSASVHESLAEARLSATRYEASIESFERAAALDTEDDYESEIQWVRARVQSPARPVELSPATLERYAGDYGPRHITFRDGALYYIRDGNDIEYRLIPMSETLFALDGLETFRIRFEPASRPTKVIGLYMNGARDESSRDP